MYLGIDVGGTSAKIGVFPSRDKGVEVDRREVRERTLDKGEIGCMNDLWAIQRAIYDLADLYGPVEGIGLAVAGKVSPERTHLAGSANLPHWVGVQIVEYFRDANQCPVVFGNDAEAAALADAVYGFGQEDDFLGMIWGTGVGGAIVRHIEGRPKVWPTEIGHQRVFFGGKRQCKCGQYGCLEASVGGNGIRATYGQPAEALKPGGREWKEILGLMTMGIRNALMLLDVPLVTFSGGIAAKQPWLLEELEARLRDELTMAQKPSVKLSQFGEKAGAIGAVALLSLDL